MSPAAWPGPRRSARAGVLSRGRHAAIVGGARRRSSRRGRRDPASVAGPDEDVHSFVERKLVERIGDAGRRLHTGRSRNEQVSLDLRLYLRRRIPLLQRRCVGLVAACADQAERRRRGADAVVHAPATAQPVLVAHFFLSHAAALRRDLRAPGRGGATKPMRCTLGSGADRGHELSGGHRGAGASARLLARRANSMDASSDRDFVAAFLYAASLAMVHLSRLAEDFILFTGEEHGFFELSDASATGSSMMPQKKNPDPAGARARQDRAGHRPARPAGWSR